MSLKKITSVCLKKLYRPPANSHKGDNGRLLIIAGSKKYHGSLVLCATMASKLVDLVYINSTKDNFEIIKKTRQKLAEFIYINEKDLAETIKEVDVVLIGPGLEINSEVKRRTDVLVQQYRDKKIILDAAALRLVNPKFLHKNCIVTPHREEFRALFKVTPTPQNVLSMSRKYPAVIVLKGKVDYIAQNGKIFYNITGNAGMTKGGTGDVLAGLIAAIATKNGLLEAAIAGAYLNGLAGDNLFKIKKFYFSASELIPEAVKVLAK